MRHHTGELRSFSSRDRAGAVPITFACCGRASIVQSKSLLNKSLLSATLRTTKKGLTDLYGEALSQECFRSRT